MVAYDCLSAEAKALMGSVGQGLRLGISKSGDHAKLFRDKRWPSHYAPLLVESDTPLRAAIELRDSGYILIFTEFMDRQRIGWREQGLDGETYDLYGTIA